MALPIPASRPPGLRRRRMAVATLVLVVATVAGYLAWQTRERPAPLKVIVTNRTVWGPDFPVVLSAVPAWQAVGEDEIVVVHDRVLGTRVATRDDALSRRSAFAGWLSRRGATLTAIDSLYRSSTSRGLDVERLQTMLGRGNVEIVPEKGEFRLVYMVAEGGVLSPRLTLSVLAAQIGDPETVTDAVEPSDFEGRSHVLTIYSYAGGTVRFVTSNYAARIASTGELSIERALLKVGGLAPLMPQ
jgi:hypothetical protein